MIASDDSDVASTINREKIENPVAYDNNCIRDELGYIENQGKLSKNLKNFYNKTGIQPYIYLKSYDETLTSDSQKDDLHKAGMNKTLIMKILSYLFTMKIKILME